MSVLRDVVRAVRRAGVGGVTSLAFALVAVVAGSISYDHIHELVGDHWYAPIYPISVDGLLVAGSLALWLERQAGRRGSPLSWASVGLGLLWSLTANIAADNPGAIPGWVIGPALAVWPPIALGLGFELLIRVRRTGTPGQPGQADGGQPVQDPAPAAGPVQQAPVHPVRSAVQAAPDTPDSTPADPADSSDRTPNRTTAPRPTLSAVADTEVVRDLRVWVSALGRPPSVNEVRGRLGCRHERAKRLLDLVVTPEPDGERAAV